MWSVYGIMRHRRKVLCVKYSRNEVTISQCWTDENVYSSKAQVIFGNFRNRTVSLLHLIRRCTLVRPSSPFLSFNLIYWSSIWTLSLDGLALWLASSNGWALWPASFDGWAQWEVSPNCPGCWTYMYGITHFVNLNTFT